MKVYKIQKYIRGWGWSTVGEVPIKEQAEDAVRILRGQGYRARVIEEE